jgi:hypothetical protein
MIEMARRKVHRTCDQVQDAQVPVCMSYHYDKERQSEYYSVHTHVVAVAADSAAQLLQTGARLGLVCPAETDDGSPLRTCRIVDVPLCQTDERCFPCVDCL